MAKVRLVSKDTLTRSDNKKPVDRIIASAGAVVASIALYQSCSISSQQKNLERQVEERQAAPLLVPGVQQPDRLGRRTFQIANSYKRVEKLSNFLMIREPQQREREPFIVVPVRNVGTGVAILLNEEVRVVDNCKTKSRRQLDPDLKERLGYYVVRPGESEQLYYAPRGDDAVEVTEEYEKANTATRVTLLIRYTDQLLRRLRWTCVTYTRGGRRDPRWSIEKPVYGDRDLPAQEREGDVLRLGSE
jgi:hypothetical protein